MTLNRKGTAALISFMLTAGMFSGCSQVSSTSNKNGGQGIRVETTMYEKVNQTIQGKQVEANKLIKNLYECIVVSQEKKDNIEIKVTVKEAYVKEEKEKKIIAEYDSINGLNVTDPLVSPTITVYSAAVGESFNAILDEKGNVKEIKESEKLEKRIIDKLKINDEKIKDKLVPVIKSEFGEGALKDKLQNIIIKQITDKKFSAGDSWISKEKVDFDTEAAVNTNYKVSKNSDNICYIDMDGKTSTEIKSDILQADNLKYIYYGSYDKNGNLEINKSNGFLSKSNVLSKFNGTMEVKDGPKDLKGKRIPTTIEIQVYINIKDKE